MKIAIIGGGMSGMVSALSLSSKHNVTIYEAHQRLGKKISMTGNGRCNISNNNISTADYNGCGIVREVLSTVPSNEVFDFLKRIGLYTYEDSAGRIYPVTDNANTVVDCLRLAIERSGVKVNLESIVTEIKGNVVISNGNSTKYDTVIFACGSASGIARPSLDKLINCEHMTKLVPSLVPIATVNANRSLNGIRSKVTAKLLLGGQVVASKVGEVLFKDYGLSGICIFELSHHIANAIKGGTKEAFAIELDLLPSINEGELAEILVQRHCSKENLLVGILHNKLAQDVIARSKSMEPSDIAYAIKHHKHVVKNLLDFNMSQVTAGGVDSKYVSNNLMYGNGNYIVGELLDVNGNCGGFNLDFAIRSALYVAKVLNK